MVLYRVSLEHEHSIVSFVVHNQREACDYDEDYDDVTPPDNDRNALSYATDNRNPNLWLYEGCFFGYLKSSRSYVRLDYDCSEAPSLFILMYLILSRCALLCP